MFREFGALFLVFSGLECLLSSHNGPAFLEEPPTHLDFTNSSGGMLNCLGQGNPSPSIRWMDVSNEYIKEIPRLREIAGNGSLYFAPFGTADFRSNVHATAYRCLLSNEVGSIVSRECKVTAEITNGLELHVANVFAIRGNIAVMKCDAGNAVPTIVKDGMYAVAWLRDHPREGKSLVQPGGRFGQTLTGDLHVRDVNGDDGHVSFYCQLTNKLTGERFLSQPGHIVVTEAESKTQPRIDYNSGNVQTQVGNSVDLVCLAQGFPPPKYKWYHEVSGMLQELRIGSSGFMKLQSSILHFDRVQPSDTATYVCVASNAAGEDKREMKLVVYSPLTAFIRPQKQVVDSGSVCIFHCTIQGGWTESSIFWLKDGQRLYGDERYDISKWGDKLVVRNVDKLDGGMYQCYVRNGEETAQAAAQLILGAVTPELEDTFIEETIEPGFPVFLRCISNGNPPPRISWMLDGGHVHVNDGYIIGSFLDTKGDVVSHLNISNARPEHGGQYTCVARNYLGHAKHSAMLNIYGPPVSRAPLNLTAVAGMDVQIRCPVSGFPVTSTTWFYGSDLLSIPSHGRQTVFSNGTLLLADVQEETDSGKFSCKVYNQRGAAAGGIVYLNVIVPPELMPFQFSSNLKEGGKAHVACSAVSGDLPITFAWKKDGKPLPQDKDIHEQVLEMVSTLRINNIGARHSGDYTCYATNPAATANYTARLIVKASPSWTLEPQDTSVLYRRSAWINCQADGYPPPKTTWTKSQGKELNHFLPLEVESNFVIYDNGSIYIENADRQHEGYYSCQAENGIGSPLVKMIFLKVNVPAHFRQGSFNQSVTADQSAVLACEAEGDFPLQITWGTSVGTVTAKNTANSAVSELRIGKVGKNHAGFYRCTASNPFGYDHATIFLAVKEAPRGIDKVGVADVGSRWLRANWTCDEDGDFHFLLQFRVEGQDYWDNTTVAEGGRRSALVEGLTPNTAYYVRVLTANDVGISKDGGQVVVKTMQEAPSGFPTDVAAENLETNSIKIKWKAPSKDTWNGDLIGFKILYGEKHRNALPNGRTVLGENKMEATITSLKFYTIYEITVCAFNKIGQGPVSETVVITTLESSPSSPPQNVQCSSTSSESLRVTWDPPPPQDWNGMLQHYKITYHLGRLLPGWPDRVDRKRTSSLETTLYGLKKYSNYSVRVIAVTNAGEGSPSIPIVCPTMEDVPGEIRRLKALVVTSSSILIVWDEPDEVNGKIIKYNVFFRTDGEETRRETVFGEITFKKFEFRNLMEFRKYEFWVSASTSAGEGESSQILQQTPTSRVPAKISSFSKSLHGLVGSPLTLRCSAVGLPTPTRRWITPRRETAKEFKLISDQALLIPSLKAEHAGNYTCVAENIFGKDEIVYKVSLVDIPQPPVLQRVTCSENEALLTWKQYGNGGAPITGFIVRSSCKNGDTVAYVDFSAETFAVRNLKCGTEYAFSVKAENLYGMSEYGNVIVAKTKGNSPISAKESEFLYVNATGMTIYTDAWPDNGCPITHMSVAYKREGARNWIAAAALSGKIPADTLAITDLTPATSYTLRVKVENDAGVTTKDYVITTRFPNGDIVPVEFINQDLLNVSRLNVIIPILSSIICVLSLGICAFILWKRNNGGKSEMKAMGNADIYTPSRMTRKDRNNSEKGVDYDVYPYATFTVTNPLQTFGANYNTGDEYDTRTLRAFKRNVATDELEIACISKQQTLPLGKKGPSFGLGPSYDEDDYNVGGGKFLRKKLPLPSTPRHEEEDDSDDDLEHAAAEIAKRRHTSRHRKKRMMKQQEHCTIQV